MKNFFLLLFSAVSFSFSQSVFPLNSENGEARDRTYHVIHYKIEVSFDELKKMLMGKVTTTLVPFTSDFTTLEFDAENMDFKKVSLGKTVLPFDSLAKTIRIHLDKAYSFRDTLTVSIEYSCVPQKGLYFIQPDSAYPDKPWQIWSQGEDMDNHFWFPCWDFPNDKATSEVIGTVKSAYTFLSNGKLVSVKEDKKVGTKTFYWKEEKPHASYLIMMAAGDYAILNDQADGIPLQYYVYKNQVDDAKVCLSHTPKIMKFFNEKIGYKYAWEKYAQVTVADFITAEWGIHRRRQCSTGFWCSMRAHESINRREPHCARICAPMVGGCRYLQRLAPYLAERELCKLFRPALYRACIRRRRIHEHHVRCTASRDSYG